MTGSLVSMDIFVSLNSLMHSVKKFDTCLRGGCKETGKADKWRTLKVFPAVGFLRGLSHFADPGKN